MREAIALKHGAQRERAAEPGDAPALATVLRVLPHDGLGGALSNAAARREMGDSERDVAHAILVVGEVNEVLPEQPLPIGGQFSVALDEMAVERRWSS